MANRVVAKIKPKDTKLDNKIIPLWSRFHNDGVILTDAQLEASISTWASDMFSAEIKYMQQKADQLDTEAVVD